jgi:hypothetical protein
VFLFIYNIYLDIIKRKTASDSSMSVSNDDEAKSATDDASIADSFHEYGNNTSPVGASSDDHSGTVLFVGNSSNRESYSPLLNQHNVWENGPDLVPSSSMDGITSTNNSPEGPIDPLQGVAYGPHFPPPSAGSLVDQSRAVSDYILEGNEDWKTKRLRLETKTYVMDDDSESL